MLTHQIAGASVTYIHLHIVCCIQCIDYGAALTIAISRAPFTLFSKVISKPLFAHRSG